MIAFLYLFSIVVFSLFLYRKIYLRRVTAILISMEGKNFSFSFKPNKAGFKAIFGDVPLTFTKIGDGIYAVSTYEASLRHQLFKDFLFTGDIVLVRINRFGKIRSVDVSSRAFSDVVSKFH